MSVASTAHDRAEGPLLVAVLALALLAACADVRARIGVAAWTVEPARN